MIDLTSGINLSPLEIEKTVTSTSPHFIEIKDDSVEYGLGFPNMMNTLWGFVCTFRRFPTQNEFMEHYISTHTVDLRRFDQSATKARVLRSYPSLAREIHFYSMARESGKFMTVFYSALYDVELGIDLQVGLGGQLYNVSCFVMTKRSIEFRKRKKTHRHQEQPNSLDLPLDLNSGKNINGWIFFDSFHVDELLNNIINYAWIHYKQHPLELIG